MQSLLFDVRGLDPLTFAGAPLVLWACAALPGQLHPRPAGRPHLAARRARTLIADASPDTHSSRFFTGLPSQGAAKLRPDHRPSSHRHPAPGFKRRQVRVIISISPQLACAFRSWERCRRLPVRRARVCLPQRGTRMHVSLSRSLAALTLFGVLGGVSVRAQDPVERAHTTFKSSADLVSIQASVRDKHGRPLGGLNDRGLRSARQRPAAFDSFSPLGSPLTSEPRDPRRHEREHAGGIENRDGAPGIRRDSGTASRRSG